MLTEKQGAEIIRLLTSCEQHLRSLTAAADARKPFRSHLKPLEAFPRFDWSSIGATVVGRDEDGPTLVEFQGEVYKRRSPQNKFGAAVWFSRSSGKNESGEPNYIRLITFKEMSSEDVDPVSRKAKQAIAARPRPQQHHTNGGARPTPAAVQVPGQPPANIDQITQHLNSLNVPLARHQNVIAGFMPRGKQVFELNARELQNLLGRMSSALQPSTVMQQAEDDIDW